MAAAASPAEGLNAKVGGTGIKASDLSGLKGKGVSADDGEDPLVSNLDSDLEHQLFAEMLERGRAQGVPLIDDPFMPLCCLRTRKYDVARAIQLLGNYHQFCADIKANDIGVNDEPLKSQLLSGKLRLGGKDIHGRQIVILQLRRHDPAVYSAADMLVLFHHVLRQALQDPMTQILGFALVNDMTGLAWGNIDSRVPKAVFSSLGDHMPGRIGVACILSPPWWARMLFPVIKSFMKKKMAERMHILPGEPLRVLAPYIDIENIAIEHGGRFEINYGAWLDAQGVTDYTLADDLSTAGAASSGADADDMAHGAGALSS